MRRIFLCLGLLASFGEVQGESLEEYTTLAAENHAGVQAAYESWEASLSNVAYARALPDPKISYAQFLRSVETRVGPQKFRVGLAQTIPWIGKLNARRDVACQRALRAERMLEAAYSQLKMDVALALYELAYARQALGIQQDLVDLAEVLEGLAQAQTKVGASSADVIQAQMELHQMNNQLLSLQESERAALARMNALLNRPTDASVDVPGDLKASTTGVRRLSVDELRHSNPYLRTLEAEQELGSAERQLAYAQRAPDVTVGVNWVGTGRALMPIPDSGKDPVSISVGMNLPIWWSTYRHREREAEAKERSREQRYAQASYDLVSQQEQVLNAVSDAERRVELFAVLLVPQAEQALEILLDEYKTGKASFERIQLAIRALLQLQLSLARAEADLGIALAKYHAFVGEA